MGLFSSKSVTTVGTQVQRVMEDTNLPDSVATGVMKNLYNEEDQMVEYVLEELVKSVAVRAPRYFNYGRDHYTFGLPKSSLKTSAAGKDATLAAIQKAVGGAINLQYYHFGAYNNLHFGWKTLVDQYGYNSSTNMLMVDGKPVYLKDMQVVVTNATLDELANGSMDQWGLAANARYVPQDLTSGLLTVVKSATPFAVDAAAASDYILVTYCWVDSAGKLQTSAFQFPVTGLDPVADYHQAMYTVNGREYYWTYHHGDGTQPAVDAVFDTVYATGGSFFPFMYFRFNKTGANEDKTSTWYKDSVKMGQMFGMDFDTIAETMNQNPDIKDVEQAMMVMAVPANTTNQLEQRYLFDFFSGVYSELQPVKGATSTSLDFMNIHLNLGDTMQETSIIIQDARFKMALAYKTIVKKLVPGNIGKVGSYTSGDNATTQNISVPMVGGGTIDWSTPQELHWYRHQLTDNVYEEIQVHGLKMTYWIFEGYTTTGDGDSNILLIPIDQEITKHYSLPDREQLYARSMQYVFNSRVITKLKWYQTGIFKALMVIIAVVITIYSYGMSWQALVAAIGSATAAQIISYILIKVIEYYVMKYAVQWFVKEVGAKFAFLAAIVIAVAACYQIYTNGALTWLPSGTQLLQASTSISSGVSNQFKNDLNDLLNEKTDFQKEVDAKEKLIDEADKLLDTGLRVDPLVIFGETPHEFYQRTVHSGNIGVVGIDVVTNYVDIALQLPKITDI